MLAGVIIHRHAWLRRDAERQHSFLCVLKKHCSARLARNGNTNGRRMDSLLCSSLARPLVASFSPLPPGAHRSYRSHRLHCSHTELSPRLSQLL